MKESMSSTFFQWLRLMGITNPVEAADLLQTDLETIKGYVSGRIAVPPEHLNKCQVLLRYNKGGAYRAKHSQDEEEAVPAPTETDF